MTDENDSLPAKNAPSHISKFIGSLFCACRHPSQSLAHLLPGEEVTTRTPDSPYQHGIRDERGQGADYSIAGLREECEKDAQGHQQDGDDAPHPVKDPSHTCGHCSVPFELYVIASICTRNKQATHALSYPK